MANARALESVMICRNCETAGTATWTRDRVLLTNRRVLLTVADGFMKVGNEVYCETCLLQAEDEELVSGLRITRHGGEAGYMEAS